MHILVWRSRFSLRFGFAAFEVISVFLSFERSHFSRDPTPYTLHPSPETRNPEPETRNPKPEIRNPKPEPQSPKPEARNPKPETRSPKPVNRNPRPEIRNPRPENSALNPQAEIPSGVASPISTSHVANEGMFVHLRNAGNLKRNLKAGSGSGTTNRSAVVCLLIYSYG